MKIAEDKDDFRTPREFFEGVCATHGDFQLDVAANSENFLVQPYYSKGNSGLINDWMGNRIWCNPPYSDPQAWIKKAIQELDLENCQQVFMLLPVDTSRRWFHDYIYERAAEIWFIKGRLVFSGPNSQPKATSPRANCLVILTKDGYKHPTVFGQMGKNGLPFNIQSKLTQYICD